MGLSSLTALQFIHLIEWANSREAPAKPSPQISGLRCGRTGITVGSEPASSYDKVRVYVNATGEATEIISGVRERLRGMNGIEVVYDYGVADLQLSLAAITTENTNGYKTGVAISYLVEKPCVESVGTMKLHYDDAQGHGIQVGSNTQRVVESIVTKVDTDYFEDQRKLNAFLKKAIPDQP